MSRTTRKQWHHDRESDQAYILTGVRDSGCSHWLCNQYKHSARKSKRARLKAALRRKPEEA